MKLKSTIFAVAALPFATLAARTVTDFNDGWEFSRDRKHWAPVAIPHDWAIGADFNPKLDSASGMLPWKGVGYYRKNLVVPGKSVPGRMFLEFDGIMCDGSVYVNGECVGHEDYGYLPLRCDITSAITATTNTVLVKADTTKLASRWYPGAGMYRKVQLVTTDRVYLPKDEIFFRTPEITNDRASCVVSGVVANRTGKTAEGEVTIRLLAPDGSVSAAKTARVSADVYADAPFEVTLDVAAPQLWDMKPGAALYTLEVAWDSESAHDLVSQRVGLRTFRLDADEGFFLNGRRVQLKGVDLHADLGPVGMAFSRDLMKRQLEIMMEMGANALRTSHNPPAPEVLDLCDEMGLFVWDECFDKWNKTAGRENEPLEKFVTDKLVKMVRRDRNHPSVIVWSMGNEIPSEEGFAPGQDKWKMSAAVGTSRERCTRFRAAMKSVDPTRPVGIGCCHTGTASKDDFAELDFTGWNYGERYMPMRKRFPGKPIIYSESASTFSVYGYYADTLAKNKKDFVGDHGMVDSYDRNSAWWSDIPDLEFERMERDRFVAGEFVWTGIDYLGEPSPYEDGTARSSYFGICDLLGFTKDRYWLYRSVWSPEKTTVHVVPDHWNFEKRELPVYVYSNGAEVELFVNGVSQGRRRKDASASFKQGYYEVMKRYRFIWDSVPYSPGEVVAVAYGADGKEIGRETLHTAGDAKRISLTPEKFGNTYVVMVTLADANGVKVPKDCREINFAAEGDVEIVAAANGDPTEKRGFSRTSSYPLHMGRAGLVVRSKGKGRITASAAGLEGASLEF